MSPSIWQILIVVGIFAIFFMGPSRLPGLGKSIGEAIRGFKKGLDDDNEIDVTDSSNRVEGGDAEETKNSAQSAKTETEPEPQKQS